MEMQATSADRNLLLEFRGELDHHGARNALRELEMAVDAALPKVLVLDMSGITFMDSSGIGVLIGRYKLVQRLGGRIAVACPSDRIREIFRLSALDKLFPFFETEEAALADLKGGMKK